MIQKTMRKIGILGFGNMGSAIAERIKDKYSIWVFDKDKNKTQNLDRIKIASSISDLLKESEAIILAVKPQDFDTVLNEIKNHIKEKLIISIAAGITTIYIQERLGAVRVIRVMPNLPAKIGEGMICLCQSKTGTEEDLDFAVKLFGYLGKTLILDEVMMDAATAISGSGPGYLYDLSEGKNTEEIKKYAYGNFIPGLAVCAQGLGFTSEQARLLAEATTKGSIAFLEKTNLTPGELKKQVASKGGTTEAGLEVLHRGGSLEEAVQAALKRARELS